jgi:hypothetical protein
MMEYREAKEEDLLEFVDTVPSSYNAWAAVENGKVFGIGGVYYDDGKAIAFSNMREDIPVKDRIKGARIIMDILSQTEGPIYAYPESYKSAPATLKHFGFEKISGSDWYVWRGP